MDAVVRVDRFVKKYGAATAVDSLSFEVAKGEIFALLGPNGAGKTSTLECLEGLRTPDGGSFSVCGLDPRSDQRRLMRKVGVQLQAQGLPSAMTVRESVEFFSRYHGHAADFAMVRRLGLEGKSNAAYGSLSTGLQRRLVLALAVMHAPELVILDEPTAGLDVESRDELHRVMLELKEGGATLLLATHDMAEAEKLADRALVLLRGKMAACASPRELTAGGSSLTRIAVATERGVLFEARPALPFAELTGAENGYLVYVSKKPGRTVSAMAAWIEEHGDEIADLRVERPTLEERFLELVKDDGEGRLLSLSKGRRPYSSDDAARINVRKGGAQ